MDKRIFMDPAGDQLRAARAWLGWSLDEAAAASGVHRMTIYRVETERTEATRATIRNLVKAYADAGIWMDEGRIMRDPADDAARD